MADDLHLSIVNSVLCQKESSMIGDLTNESEGELLSMFAEAYVPPSLAEYGRVQKIDQKLAGRAEAAERRFGIDMVPETDE
jgi:hypothetical protein